MDWEQKLSALKKVLIQILKLKILPDRSYLAGGTAAYFYAKHRLSIDLDFFTQNLFSAENIISNIRNHFKNVHVEIFEEHSLIIFLSQDKIKMSLFHLPYPLISDVVHFNLQKIACPIASLVDLEAMKSVAITQRGSIKDFVDLYYLLQNTHHTFDDLLRFTTKKYDLERRYEYHLKTSFIYFDDAEKEINSMLMFDKTGKPRTLSKQEWQKIKKFFLELIL